MRLVIDIDEDDYKHIKSYANDGILPVGWFPITKGTPLSNVLVNIRGDIWLDGVNMTGEYQGVWTRFRDVEKAFDKALKEGEG